jgi:hypothetical protein
MLNAALKDHNPPTPKCGYNVQAKEEREEITDPSDVEAICTAFLE